MSTWRTRSANRILIDIHVGKRVAIYRRLAGLSQEALGDAIGVTFQQVQKYEKGANRIGASRLFAIAQTLDVPLHVFFDGLPEQPSDRNVSGALPDPRREPEGHRADARVRGDRG